MKYKEFKKEIEDWGRKYNYATEVTVGDFGIHLKVEFDGELWLISTIGDIDRFELNTTWAGFSKIRIQARAELLDILVDLAKTPIGDRKDEKRFIIPLYRARLKVITNEFIASYLRTQSSDAEERLKALEIGSKYIHEDYRHLSEFTEDELKKLNIWDSEQWEVEEVEE